MTLAFILFVGICSIGIVAESKALSDSNVTVEITPDLNGATYAKDPKTGEVISRDIVIGDIITYTINLYSTGSKPAENIITNVTVDTSAFAHVEGELHYITPSLESGFISSIVIKLRLLKEIPANGTGFDVTVSAQCEGMQQPVSATYKLKRRYSVITSADPAEGGSITAPILGAEGPQTITYAPKQGYRLAGLTLDGNALSINAYPSSYAFSELTKDHFFTVKFAECYDLSNVSVQQTGTLTYSGQPQRANVTASATAVNNRAVTFTYSTGQNEPYTEEVPAFTDAGTHTVYYKVSAAEHHVATGSFAVTIGKKDVRVSGIKAWDKLYDATAAAHLDFSAAVFDGKLAGDTLTVSGTGTFSDAEIGENKTVTLNGLTLLGTHAGNYQLAASGQQLTARASIRPNPLKATVTDYSGIYDGAAHSINVTSGEQGVKITYSEKEDGPYTETNPAFVKAGIYTVYFKAIKGSVEESGSGSVTIEKAEAKETVAPAAVKGMAANGTAQKLVTAGTGEDGQMVYTTGEDAVNVPTGGWTTDIPTGTGAGIYHVWYMVRGDENHNDTRPACIPVTISAVETVTITFDSAGGSEVKSKTVEKGKTADRPAAPVRSGYTFEAWLHDHVPYDFTRPVYTDLTLTALWKADSSTYAYSVGNGSTWMQKSGRTLIFRIENTNKADDGKTFDRFSGIRVDGNRVEPSDYKKKPGSVIIELQPDYLETLNAGEHRLTAEFEDGAAEAGFTVAENVVTPENLPKTGDTGSPLLYGLAVLAACIGLGWLIRRK